ncbi:MAG: dihydrolipoamide acetyltransferase family protein [Zetaproteobacteria bacterium]|nr:dihydrolipoamide acetyltransferase family protein [Zetaproteobacteria bacterium]
MMSAEFAAVYLPQMGEGIFEAGVVKWLKKPGDKVVVGEPLVEVATDKVDTEVIADNAGYLLACLVQEGATAQVGGVIAVLGHRQDADASAYLATQAKTDASLSSPSRVGAHSKPPVEGNAVDRHRSVRDVYRGITSQYAGVLRATPAARALAATQSLDMGGVSPSRPDGVITRADVANSLAQSSSLVASVPTNTCKPNLEDTLFRVSTQITDAAQEYLEGVLCERVAMDRVRERTAAHMITSIRTSPRASTYFDVCLSRVADLRRKQKVKITYTAYLIHAAVAALEKFPQLNAAVDGKDILLRKSINIGCAVATNKGLMVPVLKGLQASLSVEEIAARLHELGERAHAGALCSQDLVGGTFTITNPGMYGCILSEPIIHQPQVAILSVGKIVESVCMAAFKQGRMETEPRCLLGLTFDHRALDGEAAAKFMQSVQFQLEVGQT